MDINGIAAIVTGGASGLGKATAAMLAARGAKVTIFDLNEPVGRATAAEIGARFVSVNVGDEAGLAAGLDAGESAHGVARILVNCAGIAPAAKTVGKENVPHPLEIFRKTVEVNLIGTFNVISRFAARAATVPEIEGERGVIINTASVAAFEGQIGQAAYSASKGGVVGMTLPIARDLAQHKIRVMTVAPGIFHTPMLGGLREDIQKSLAESVPFPKLLGTPEEYAALVMHMVENRYLNGDTIRLDGALRMAPR